VTDPMSVRGRLRITARDQAGRVVEERIVPNLVVLAGRNLVRDHLITGATPVLSHMAVGTGTTAANAADTTLEAEVHRDLITATNTSDGELELLLFLGSTVANGEDITEAGIFTSGFGGTLFARTTFTAITKTASVSVTFTWTITIGGS
jgi:hypothetical protein